MLFPQGQAVEGLLLPHKCSWLVKAMGLKLTLSRGQQRKPKQKKLRVLRLHPPILQV